MGRYRDMGTDELVLQVAGHLEIGNAPGGRPFHRELCVRLKDGPRARAVKTKREEIRRGVVIFKPLDSPAMSEALSPMQAAIAAYTNGGWEAFDEHCKQQRMANPEFQAEELLKGGLLDVVSTMAAAAFTGTCSARKKFQEHLSFIKHHDHRMAGWLLANSFARAAHQWLELGEYELAARLYRGAHSIAPQQMVSSGFEMVGIDTISLSSVHRY